MAPLLQQSPFSVFSTVLRWTIQTLITHLFLFLFRAVSEIFYSWAWLNMSTQQFNSQTDSKPTTIHRTEAFSDQVPPSVSYWIWVFFLVKPVQFGSICVLWIPLEVINHTCGSFVCSSQHVCETLNLCVAQGQSNVRMFKNRPVCFFCFEPVVSSCVVKVFQPEEMEFCRSCFSFSLIFIHCSAETGSVVEGWGEKMRQKSVFEPFRPGVSKPREGGYSWPTNPPTSGPQPDVSNNYILPNLLPKFWHQTKTLISSSSRGPQVIWDWDACFRLCHRRGDIQVLRWKSTHISSAVNRCLFFFFFASVHVKENVSVLNYWLVVQWRHDTVETVGVD